MTVRFVVGRAGCGKTHRCLEAVRERLTADAAQADAQRPDDRPRLLLLVPEQASFQMERALIETPELPAYTRCEVVSFQRLAFRIFAETGADPRRADQTIGSLGRLMVLRKLIDQQQAGLQVFDAVASRPGLIKQVADTIDELMRESVEPDDLATLAEKRSDEDPLGAAKLSDLTRIYQAYLDYLLDDRIDPAQYLAVAAERIEAVPWLDGAEVWVDGFAGFTQQEYQILVELAKRAASMEITALLDPKASAITATELPKESYSRFVRTERTLVKLRQAFEAAGVTIDEPVRLEVEEAGRFVNPELRRLERNLFTDATMDEAESGKAHVAQASRLCSTGETPVPHFPSVPHLPSVPHFPSVPHLPSVPDALRSPQLLSFADRRSEVDAAVAEIKRLTSLAGTGENPPMRYRDIAIIVRDLTSYHDLIGSALRSNNIPFFLDRRQPTTHHPLVELVRGLLAVCAHDAPLNAVQMLLKTGLLPMSTDDCDLLENYLIAHGINGFGQWKEDWRYVRMFRHRGEKEELSPHQRATLQRVNSIRSQWIELFDEWMAMADRDLAPSGREWAAALFATLEQLGVGQRLMQWAVDAEADGNAAETDMHRQVWQDFIELLDEFVRALGSDLMSAKEFADAIEAGLAEFTLGLAPPALDQVLVGSIERSRHPAIRAALVLGFDESHFPLRRSEDPLLGDDERDMMEQLGMPAGASRLRQIIEERMLAYIALTRASDSLWISYPRTEADGKPLQPSMYLDAVKEALGDVEIQWVDDPAIHRKPMHVSGLRGLGAKLANEIRSRATLEEESAEALPVRSLWNRLYESLRGNVELQYDLRRILGGLAYRNDAVLASGLIDKAVGDPFVASVSRLEKFAECPFAHYANSLLVLDERPEAALSQVDLGSLAHFVLEKLVKEIADEGGRLADLEDDEITERVDRMTKEALNRYGEELIVTPGRQHYLIDRSREQLARVLRWQRNAARAGNYRPIAVEFPFGYSDSGIAPLTLRTPKGRQILLRGKIDRVDIAELGDDWVGMVIDYKRTNKKMLSLGEAYHGLALQLVGYLLALQQCGESLTGRPIRPVAALYLPLLEPFKSVPSPDDSKPYPFLSRGVIDQDGLEVIDATVGPGGKSEFVSARLKKDGEPYKDGDLRRTEQFVALMQHVGRRMGELADHLLDGDISVSPYRLSNHVPCTFCQYRSLCRFESALQPARALVSISGDDALALMVQEQEDADG